MAVGRVQRIDMPAVPPAALREALVRYPVGRQIPEAHAASVERLAPAAEFHHAHDGICAGPRRRPTYDGRGSARHLRTAPGASIGRGPMSAGRWLVLTAATIVVLIAVSVAVVALRPGPTAFDPDTPEGTVQRYVAAVIDRDLPAAWALFDAELAERCTASTFDRTVQEAFWWGARSGRDDLHVRLVESVPLSGDRVRVTVSVERTVVRPPFDVGGFTSIYDFVVGREADAWRIVSFDWPSPCF